VIPALESVRFTVFGPPRPKERPRLGKGGRTYTPPRTVQYERAVREVAAIHCGHALDGLQGVAFDNDRQVVELEARKSVEPGRLERTEVLIERVGDAPRRKARR
jgi:Holliday junction resolvase RusA-like endonuclease